MKKCKKCGWEGPDDLFTVVHHYDHPDYIEDWCLDCFYDEFDYCSDCGKAFPKDELNDIDEVGVGLLCDRCVEFY
jgi:hypothetical protein